MEEETFDELKLCSAAAAACALEEPAEEGARKREAGGEDAAEEVDECGAKIARVHATAVTSDFVPPRWEDLAPNVGHSTPVRHDDLAGLNEWREWLRYLQPRKLLDALAWGRLEKVLEKQGRQWGDLPAHEQAYLRGAVAEFVVEAAAHDFAARSERAAVDEASGRPGARTEARLTEVARDPELAAPRSALYLRDDGTLSGFPLDRLQRRVGEDRAPCGFLRVGTLGRGEEDGEGAGAAAAAAEGVRVAQEAGGETA